MPKSFGSLLGWTVGALLVVAVGAALITRVPPLRKLIFKEYDGPGT